MVSLHGGHSGEFCDHAEGSLREILDAAIDAGYHTFGVSEHAPRCEDRFTYPNERKTRLVRREDHVGLSAIHENPS